MKRIIFILFLFVARSGGAFDYCAGADRPTAPQPEREAALAQTIEEVSALLVRSFEALRQASRSIQRGSMSTVPLPDPEPPPRRILRELALISAARWLDAKQQLCGCPLVSANSPADCDLLHQEWTQLKGYVPPHPRAPQIDRLRKGR